LGEGLGDGCVVSLRPICGDIDIVVDLYALVARNPQLGDFIGVRLESGEKFELIIIPIYIYFNHVAWMYAGQRNYIDVLFE